MGDSIILAILGIVATLAAALAWVVKKVFDFSERHVQVVENNTKSNDAVASTLRQVVADLKAHEDNVRPALVATTEMVGFMNSMSSQIGKIVDTQKEIIELLKPNQ